MIIIFLCSGEVCNRPRQCPGEVCSRFLPSKENDPYRLCVACRVKSCKIDDRCEECHNWSDDCCIRVSDYMHKLSLQREKKCERKAMASSLPLFFSSGFSSLMLIPLCRLPSFAGAGVVMTTPSPMARAVTFLAAAPVVSAASFVPPVDITLVEPGCKRRLVKSPRE